MTSQDRDGSQPPRYNVEGNNGHYSEKLATQRYTSGCSNSLDLIESLPPEVALRCIQASLPSDVGYTPRLLVFASISQRWQYFILSAPTLWSKIYVIRTAPDLLASIAISVHQSGTTPLSIIIEGDVGEEWDDIKTILLPHARRIRKLRLDQLHHHWSRDTGHHSDAISIIRSLDYLPNLQELRFRASQMDLYQLQHLRLPSEARIMSELRVDRDFIEYQNVMLSQFSNMAIHSCLDAIFPALHSLTSLSSLALTPGSLLPSLDRSTLVMTRGMLPHLSHLTHLHAYTSNLDVLLRFTAPQLIRLNIRILSSEIGELVDVLQVLEHLQELRVVVGFTRKRAPSTTASYGVASRALRYLGIFTEITRNTKLANDAGPFMGLFTALTRLYQAANSVDVSGISFLTGPLFTFLESLVFIKSLSIVNKADRFPPGSMFNLPVVTELILENPSPLKHLRLPNLLRLEVYRAFNDTDLADLKQPYLRHLLMTTDTHEGETFTLDPLSYPELQRLYIRMLVSKGKWKLSSLPHLTYFTLTSAGMNVPGNQLCMSLIYDPEQCPSLQELHFLQFIEWDILFLLLERRNIGSRGVQRIQKVTVPYVPPGLRQPLDDLLSARRLQGWSNLPLSLEETREVVCDPEIQGCLSCLKYMWPHCSSRTALLGTTLDIIFPEYDDPPGSVPVEIRHWLTQHRVFQKLWTDSYAVFQQTSYRDWSCTRSNNAVSHLRRV